MKQIKITKIIWLVATCGFWQVQILLCGTGTPSYGIARVYVPRPIRQYIERGGQIVHRMEAPLKEAAYDGDVQKIRELLRAGYPVNQGGPSPLEIAVLRDKAEAARELVKAGAMLTPTAVTDLTYQGKTTLLAELQDLTKQRLKEVLTFLERAPERLPDDIADLLLQFESLPAEQLQQLRAIRTQQRQAVQQP